MPEAGTAHAVPAFFSLPAATRQPPAASSETPDASRQTPATASRAREPRAGVVDSAHPMGSRRRLFLGLYAASGAAALVYEVTWTRLLTLQLGHTVAAASTVLAAFMGG